MLKNLLKRLPHNYNKNTDSNVGKLLNIFTNELTEIRDTVDKVSLWHDIDKAKGETLDRIGNNVGQPRRGLGDDIYRIMIKTRIVANLSGGEMYRINEVMQVILGEYYQGTIELWDKPEYDNQPAAIIIQSSNAPAFLDEEENIIREDVQEVAKRVVAAGIGVDWIIPRLVISPKIQAINSVLQEVSQKVITDNEPVNSVPQEITVAFSQPKIHRLEGHHLLNGETYLDAERQFIVNKVEIKEVS